jgi:hypothetical protein
LEHPQLCHLNLVTWLVIITQIKLDHLSQHFICTRLASMECIRRHQRLMSHHDFLDKRINMDIQQGMMHQDLDLGVKPSIT